jgi:molecular chaperone DnaK (HSP70)
VQTSIQREAGGALRAPRWSIGLDFGTAFSKAALAPMGEDGRPNANDLAPLRIGEAAGWTQPFLTPSAMFLDRERIHLGARAVALLRRADLPDRELVRSFKKALGAADFERALQRYPRATVDPDRMFRLHDLIVLYLAYLLALVDLSARASTGASIVAGSRLRFTRPGWIPDRIAAAHETMTGLFVQAQAVFAALGSSLCAAEGIPYAQARAALDNAQRLPASSSSLDGGIYEATAVGLCHYADVGAPNCLLIVDVGGGTTDIAGLVRAPLDSNVAIVRAGRSTIERAGDDFDAILADLLSAKAKLQSTAEETRFRRALAPSIREFKAELVARGAASFVAQGKRVECTIKEFENRAACRKLVAEIAALYEQCLMELVDTARGHGFRSVGVVLAGGGVSLPAMRAALSKRKSVRRVKIRFLSEAPHWLHRGAHGGAFSPVFSQLSAALGAAISTPQSDAAESGVARYAEPASPPAS